MSRASLYDPAEFEDAVSREDIEEWESDLQGLFTRMGSLFYRTESRLHAEQYMRGLLSDLKRKNGWTIAERVGEINPKPLQRFLNKSPWDADELLDLNRAYAMEHLASPKGIVVAAGRSAPGPGPGSHRPRTCRSGSCLPGPTSRSTAAARRPSRGPSS